MEKPTFHGSCKCGAVRFSAAIDLSQGTTKCNCTTCWKHRFWSVRAKPEDFQAHCGEELLTGSPLRFCPTCGVLTFMHVPAAEWNDGAYVSISVAALDDLDPQQLMAAPVKLCDGRKNDWWHAPEYSAHL